MDKATRDRWNLTLHPMDVSWWFGCLCCLGSVVVGVRGFFVDQPEWMDGLWSVLMMPMIIHILVVIYRLKTGR